MKPFRIIEDRTINYKDGQQLFVMIIKQHDRYLLQIDTRHFNIGRRFVRDLKVADIVVQQSIASLSSYKDIHTAIDTLELAYSLNTLKAFMFVVNIFEKEYSLDDIFKMRRSYSFQTNTKWCDDDEDPLKAKEVAILFDGYEHPLGLFKICDTTEKFKFELNELFVLNLSCDIKL